MWSPFSQTKFNNLKFISRKMKPLQNRLELENCFTEVPGKIFKAIIFEQKNNTEIEPESEIMS